MTNKIKIELTFDEAEVVSQALYDYARTSDHEDFRLADDLHEMVWKKILDAPAEARHAP